MTPRDGPLAPGPPGASGPFHRDLNAVERPAARQPAASSISSAVAVPG